MSRMTLPDGRYTSEDVHAYHATPELRELCPHLPQHDPRFKAVIVKNGAVVDVEFEAPQPVHEAPVSAPPAVRSPVEPSRAGNVGDSPEPDDPAPAKRNPTVDATGESEPDAPPLTKTELNLIELQALCKERGLSAHGTKIQLLARLQKR